MTGAFWRFFCNPFMTFPVLGGKFIMAHWVRLRVHQYPPELAALSAGGDLALVGHLELSKIEQVHCPVQGIKTYIYRSRQWARYHRMQAPVGWIDTYHRTSYSRATGRRRHRRLVTNECHADVTSPIRRRGRYHVTFHGGPGRRQA